MSSSLPLIPSSVRIPSTSYLPIQNVLTSNSTPNYDNSLNINCNTPSTDYCSRLFPINLSTIMNNNSSQQNQITRKFTNAYNGSGWYIERREKVNDGRNNIIKTLMEGPYSQYNLRDIRIFWLKDYLEIESSDVSHYLVEYSSLNNYDNENPSKEFILTINLIQCY